MTVWGEKDYTCEFVHRVRSVLTLKTSLISTSQVGSPKITSSSKMIKKKKKGTTVSSSPWVKIKFYQAGKVAKYSTNLLTGKLNLKETLLVKFMIWILINGQCQQRKWRFLALATADFCTDSRQCRHLDKG